MSYIVHQTETLAAKIGEGVRRLTLRIEGLERLVEQALTETPMELMNQLLLDERATPADLRAIAERLAVVAESIEQADRLAVPERARAS